MKLKFITNVDIFLDNFLEEIEKSFELLPVDKSFRILQTV